MRRWFISYHSPDQTLAEALKLSIEQREAGAEVFFAPQSLRAGFWSRALAERIAAADVFVLLIGAKGVGPWQVVEYDEAFARKVKEPAFQLAVVLLEGQAAPGLHWLGQLNWIVSPDPASEKDVGRLIAAVSGAESRPAEPWRHTMPYRGLLAMEETDSDFFFGRAKETVEVLQALAAHADRLPVLLGNSGVGKTSVARAGVLAALKRQEWPQVNGIGARGGGEWPGVFSESRRWCFLTLKPGTDPLRALVATFLDIWQYSAADPTRARLQHDWTDLLREGKAGLRELLEATDRRYGELDLESPPAYFVYVDQGEELYVRAEVLSGQRFSALFSDGIADPRLFAMMSLRTDFLGELHKDVRLHEVHLKIDVPPLREAELREVVGRPASLLSARFESEELAETIARRTAKESVRDVGALPLLSYTLDDMWRQMLDRDDGVLRLAAASFEPSGVLAERAEGFLVNRPEAEDAVRRILTLKLVTVRQAERPTLRRALRGEFADDEWRLVCDLADHPNRLVVVGSSPSGETFAEIAHETIFERWRRLRRWIKAERQFLIWRSGLEAARRTWQSIDDAAKPEALLMGVALKDARDWNAIRRADLSDIDRTFVDLSLARDARRRSWERRNQVVVPSLVFVILIVIVGWMNHSVVMSEVGWWGTSRPYRAIHFERHILPLEKEKALLAGELLHECDKDCPRMVVLPPDHFTMGSPASEPGRYGREGPPLKVEIPRAFAVSKYETTFDDWYACVKAGGCSEDERPRNRSDGWGRQPVVNVSWSSAKQYAAWLSLMTGKRYRLLTEAEWEYAARAGSQEAYSWGMNVPRNGRPLANCGGCGSEYDSKRTAPVGEFAANKFGLHDMHGNVWEWVEDCWQPDLRNTPSDGATWGSEECTERVIRGGSFLDPPSEVRSAMRHFGPVDGQFRDIGFRVARALEQ